MHVQVRRSRRQTTRPCFRTRKVSRRLEPVHGNESDLWPLHHRIMQQSPQAIGLLSLSRRSRGRLLRMLTSRCTQSGVNSSVTTEIGDVSDETTHVIFPAQFLECNRVYILVEYESDRECQAIQCEAFCADGEG